MNPLLCKSCGREKPAEEFPRDSSSKSGRCRYCLVCSRKRSNDYHASRRDDPAYKLRKVRACMIQRTTNPNVRAYRYYGAVGIGVCPEWLDDAKSFYAWAMKSGYAPGLTLERIDRTGDYTPDNCTWATMLVQAQNRSSVRLVSASGDVMSRAMWARDGRCAVTYPTLRYRIVAGWTPEEAIPSLPGTVRHRWKTRRKPAGPVTTTAVSATGDGFMESSSSHRSQASAVP